MRDPSHQATSARMNGYGTMVLVRYLAGAPPELEVYDGIRNRVVAVAYSLNETIVVVVDLAMVHFVSLVGRLKDRVTGP